MRVLYQCNGFLPGTIGGAEVLSYHLVKELSRRGHEILVVTSRANSDPLGRQTFEGVDLVKLDFGAALASRNLSALRGLGRIVGELVRSFGPDLLHLNDALSSSFLFLRGGATGHLPRLLTLHAPIRPAGRDGLQVRLAADADRVVAVSQPQHDAAAATMPAMRSKMSVIPNALPFPDLPPADLPFAPAVLLCIGRLMSDKGFDVAIRAFAHLRARGTSARLTIAGKGSEKSNLEDLAQKLGVAGHIEFVDWVMPDRVPSLINAATAVLVPSRWPEPFGLVALQAAQMGRPAIASAVGGLPQIVEHRVTGLLVEPDDAHAAADAIQDVLSDPALARRMGENARRRAREQFRFNPFVDAYERVYAKARETAVRGQTTADMIA